MSTKIYKKNELGAYSVLKDVQNIYDNLDFEYNEPASDSLYVVNRTSFKLPLLQWTTIYEVEDLKDIYDLTFHVRNQTGGTSHLVSTRETHYENGVAKLETETNYYYDDDHHYQLRAVEHLQSDSTEETTVMTYPLDYPSGTGFIQAMKSRNLMNYPIEKVTYQKRNGNYKILSGVLNKYNSTNSERLDEVSVIENEKPIPLSEFRFSSRAIGELPLSGVPSGFLPYSGYVTKLTYDKYDSKGNILQYSTPDNIKVSYLWGYNYGFPVAEIKNVTYDQVLSVLGQTLINELNNSPGTDAEVRQKLQPLYTHPSLKGALITVFTYNTMFGVTSVTDNNGLITFYNYDGLGRLKTVKDNDQNVVKNIVYKYRSSQSIH